MFDRSRLKFFPEEESGSSALEFTILGPIFLMMFLGSLMLGWAIFTISNVNFVAERAGRVLQLNPSMSSSEVSTAIKTQLAYLDQDNLTVALAISTGTGGYRMGRATVTYQFRFEVPLVGSYPISYSSTVSVPLV